MGDIIGHMAEYKARKRLERANNDAMRQAAEWWRLAVERGMAGTSVGLRHAAVIRQSIIEQIIREAPDEVTRDSATSTGNSRRRPRLAPRSTSTR